MRNYCGTCGERLRTETSRGGIPRRVCPNDPHDDGGDGT